MRMERGVYFDAWFPRQHNYHPSLPPRRLKMVDDLVDYRATVLVWSALGGGSISLPYLEQEAWGEIDPRFRMYGFVNDSEFIAAAQAQGIKVFGIVFEVQGWEFPVELNDAEDRILALNELQGEGHRDWLGLREFTQDRYPHLWKSHRAYFPDGLVNSDGEIVTDILDECCSRDIHGQPCHAHWVECPDREHYCYTMDRNNPVWREYLKAIIRIQVDAGVAGIQLDEAELPLTTLQYGGCFCKECMKQFRAYLQALPPDALPGELKGTDLTRFHYGEWLLERGFDFKSNRESIPLFWTYIRFQRTAITRYFREMTDFARTYAASQGRSIEVSGNFFNCLDQYYALEPDVDLIMTEMRNTQYRQPTWYRYIRGFAGEKPVVVVENPYGGIVPDLVAKLQRGEGYDLFRMSLYEAAALGANMSVPYGSWMGSVEEDAFYAPHDLCVEIQDFLADHAYLFSPGSLADTAVIYSVESNFYGGARPEEIANNPENAASRTRLPFWDACQTLADARQPWDVRFFPEGTLRADAAANLDLGHYRTVILPHCHWLSAPQAEAIGRFLDGGGQVIATGPFGENLDQRHRRDLMGHPGTTVVDDVETGELPISRQIIWGDDTDLAINIVPVARGVALHLIRYDHDDIAGKVPILPRLECTVRLDGDFASIKLFSPGDLLGGSMRREGNLYHITLENVPLYGIVLLESQAT
jgi:hypothetical protein